jgi:hypothetical protein
VRTEVKEEMVAEGGVIGFPIRSLFKGGICEERLRAHESRLDLRANGQIYLNGKIAEP